MMIDDYDGQMIFGDLVGLKLPDIRLTDEENPEKTSPRKLVPTGDRTRARCVRSAHATTCSTAVAFRHHHYYEGHPETKNVCAYNSGTCFVAVDHWFPVFSKMLTIIVSCN